MKNQISSFIKIVTVAGIALTGAAACTTTNTGQSTVSAVPVHKMPHMKRPNLVVSDIERSLTIYRDILGLGASEVREGPKDSYSYPVFNFPENASLRFVSLHEAAEQRILNLTEATGIQLPKPQSAAHMTALVIGIEDLEEKFVQLEALGLKIIEPRISQGQDFKFVEQAFVDFDGHLVVCYQTIPE